MTGALMTPAALPELELAPAAVVVPGDEAVMLEEASAIDDEEAASIEVDESLSLSLSSPVAVEEAVEEAAPAEAVALDATASAVE